MADSSSQFDPRAEDLFRDFLARVDAGQSIDFEQICRSHPGFEHDLRALRDAFEVMERIRPEAGDARSLRDRLQQRHGVTTDPTLEIGERAEHGSGTSSKLIERLRADGPRGTRYRLLGEVARGGMGAVLRVWDDDLRRTLAMKVVLGRNEASTGDTPDVDPKTLGRFLEEAQVTGQLDHPGIVPVHELGLGSDGRVYFTMRLVRGEDLRSIFDKIRRGEDGWNEIRALGVLLKVCEAMSYAHSKHVLHRDLKPANVMVGKFGEVYVMDWGLARVLGRPDRHDVRLRETPAATASVVRTERREDREGTPDSPLVTMDGDVVGTPAYMPLEQAQGKLELLGAYSDVYSVGAMLYQLLAGEMPFVPRDAKVSQHTVLMRVLEGPPKPLAELALRAPAELVAICEKAMERRLDERYPTMQALADDLRAYVEGRVVAAYETGALAEARKWVRRNRPTALATAAALVIAIGGLASVLWVQSTGRREVQASNDRLTGANEQLSSTNTRLDETLSQLTLAKARSDAESSAKHLALKETAEQYERSEALRLIAESSNQLHINPGLALLLAIEGGRRAPGLAANNALCAALDSCYEVRTYAGLQGAPRFMSWSRDGRRLMSGDTEGNVIVWDFDSGQIECELRVGNNWVSSGEFDPSGSRALIFCSGVGASMWSLSSRTELWPARFTHFSGECRFSTSGAKVFLVESSACRILDAESGDVLVVCDSPPEQSVYFNDGAWTPDDAHVAAAISSGRVSLWDASTGALRWSIPAHTSFVDVLEFDSSGTRLLTGSRDGSVRVSRVSDGEPVVSLSGLGPSPRAAFAPDGSKFLVAIAGGDVSIRRSDDGELLRTVRTGNASHGSLSWSRDGAWLATTAPELTVQVWDLLRGELRATLAGHYAAIDGIQIAPDGETLLTLSGDGTLRRWDVRADRALALPRGSERAIASPMFDRLASRVAYLDSANAAVVKDVATRLEVAQVRAETGPFRELRLSPEGTRLATVEDSVVRLWDAADGALIATYSNEFEDIHDLSFSSDDSRFVTAGESGAVGRVWNARTGEPICALRDGMVPTGYGVGKFSIPAGNRRVDGARFAPDGTRLVTASWDRVCRLFDTFSGSALLTLEGHSEICRIARFDADGRRIVSAADDGASVIWDSETGRPLVVLRSQTSGPFDSLLSPDGTLVRTHSTYDSTIGIWSADSGEQIATLRGHTGSVRSASFSSDSRHLVSVGGDRTARVWSLPDATETHTLRGATSTIASAVIGERCDEVISVSTDGSLRTWPLDPLAAALRQRPRTLTLEERDRFSIGSNDERRAAVTDPRQLDASSRSIAESRTSTEDEFREALRRALLACELAPGVAAYWTSVAMARYRLGDHAGTIEACNRSASCASEVDLRTRVENTAFIALAQHLAGDAKSARESMAQLVELSRETEWYRVRRSVRDLLDELSQTLGSAASAALIQDEQSQVVESGFVGRPLRAAGRHVVHVVDATTRMELDGVEIAVGGDWRTDDLGHPGREGANQILVSHVHSPTALPIQEGRASTRVYWIRAAGHAWSRVSLDANAQEETTISLELGSTVTVELAGAPPLEGCRLVVREYPDVEKLKVSLRRHLERTDDAQEQADAEWFRSEARAACVQELEGLEQGVVSEEKIFAGRPWAEVPRIGSGPIVVEGLPCRRMSVAVELGDWFREPQRFATAIVDLSAETTAQVRFELEPQRVPARIPLAGKVSIGAGWGPIEIGLVVNPERVPFLTDDSRVTAQLGPATTDAAGCTIRSWDAGMLLTGTYQLELDVFGHEQSLILEDPGATDVEIVIPAPGECILRFLDDATGSTVRIERSTWSRMLPDDPFPRASEQLEPTGAKNECRFRAPQGRIAVHVWDPRFAFGWHEFTVGPGTNTFELRLKKDCGVRVTMAAGERPVPWDDDIHDVEVESVDANRGSTSWNWSNGAVRVGVHEPGRYRLTFGRFPGYKPVAPIEVDVRAAEFTEVVLQLEKDE